jgi:hypothetical protein
MFTSQFTLAFYFRRLSRYPEVIDYETQPYKSFSILRIKENLNSTPNLPELLILNIYLLGDKSIFLTYKPPNALEKKELTLDKTNEGCWVLFVISYQKA